MKSIQLLLLLSASILFGTSPSAAPAADNGAPLASMEVGAPGASDQTSWEGAVEAVRQTLVAAQISGAIVALPVKAGDRVQAGQLLMRIDARAADQTAASSQAQVAAARAALEVASKEFERQGKLAKQGFISQAALDTAEAQFKSTKAQAAAQLAQANASKTQSDFHVVRAPYAGVIAEVPVTLGDMAMPGRALLSIYDPTALRVTLSVPEVVAARLVGVKTARVEIPGATGAAQVSENVAIKVLPAVDPNTHTAQVWLSLPVAASAAVVPGMFARATFATSASMSADVSTRLLVPQSAVVRRAEFSGVYVIGSAAKPQLRQIRPGRTVGANVEVLSGISAGEKVALDPQAAAKVR